MTDLNTLTDGDLNAWSDLHKDVYGFRPRFKHKFSSVEDYRLEMKRLCEELDHASRIERQRQYRRLRSVIADLRSLMEHHGCTLWEAADAYLYREKGDYSYREYDQQFEQVLWSLNLPYSWWPRIIRWARRENLIDF